MKTKGIKKGIIALLTIAMTIGLLSGCGKSAEKDNTATKGEETIVTPSESNVADTTLDTSEEVELVMYVISDRPAGQDVFDENLNKLLKEKLNCTLKINWLGWAEQGNKYPLLFSSGEKFDMAYSSTWTGFSNLANRGAFMNLDELWPTYAPKNFARQSDEAKRQATIDGHYYTVPTLYATYNADGVLYRTDIMEGTDWNGKMENFEDVEAYCHIVKATRPELEPIDISSGGAEGLFYTYSSSKNLTLVDKGMPGLLFDPNEEEPKVMIAYETEEMKEYLDIIKRWSEKGFFSKSALSDTNTTKTLNGQAALKFSNPTAFKDYSVRHPEWEFQYSNMVQSVAHLPFIQDSMVISNTSVNPERALAFWDLVTNDQEVYNAFFYGVYGETYELDENNQLILKNPDLYSTSAMWAARTNEFDIPLAGTPDEYLTMLNDFESSIQSGKGNEKYAGFSFDTSSLETELAACKNVQQQYGVPLLTGYIDIESGLKDYQKQMEAAGIIKMKEEAQRQLDEYIASLNK